MCGIPKIPCHFQIIQMLFLSDRVEYVGHDLLQDSNTPAKYKFNVIRDWQFTSSGQLLFSFIG